MYSINNLDRAFRIKKIKLYSDTIFRDFVSAYKYINIPELSTSEKIISGILSDSLKVVRLSHEERLELYNEANELSANSRQENELESAVKVYKALLVTDKKLDDKKLTNFKNMIRKKFSEDRDYDSRVTDYKLLVELRYTLHNNDRGKFNASILATDYGALAFYKLFVKDFNGAIEYAQKGLETDSSLHWINTNLALGYLFNKQFTESDKIYVKYRDELKLSFLQDFLALENAGMLPRKEEDVTIKIKKVRDYLNGLRTTID